MVFFVFRFVMSCWVGVGRGEDLFCVVVLWLHSLVSCCACGVYWDGLLVLGFCICVGDGWLFCLGVCVGGFVGLGVGLVGFGAGDGLGFYVFLGGGGVLFVLWFKVFLWFFVVCCYWV